MAKKKRKISRKKRAKKKQKKRKMPPEDQQPKGTLEVSHTCGDVKSFIERFRTDVKRRREAYQSFAQKFRRKKSK